MLTQVWLWVPDNGSIFSQDYTYRLFFFPRDLFWWPRSRPYMNPIFDEHSKPSKHEALGQRRRRWANVSPPLDQRLLFLENPDMAKTDVPKKHPRSIYEIRCTLWWNKQIYVASSPCPRQCQWLDMRPENPFYWADAWRGCIYALRMCHTLWRLYKELWKCMGPY